MQVVAETFDLLEAMARHGNPASASDAGVGTLCARAAIRGAWLNVLTNAGGIKDRQAVDRILAEGRTLEQAAAAREAEILSLVEAKFA
jgi:glutamate formiminotransferase/formiminotetrahydrofolate cyclodeaminase